MRPPFAILLIVALWGCSNRGPEAAIPTDQPGEAMRRYVENRLPPGSRDLPMERYVLARDQIRRMRVYSSRRHAFVGAKDRGQREISLGQWQALGPGNIGGRTRAFVIDPVNPGILYAAGVAGGVWKSSDEGASWHPLADFMANLAVSTLAMDPSNPRVLYAGTGEGFSNIDAVAGAGIFKTSDAGATWEWLPNAPFRFTNKIFISKSNPARVYAATSTGVWRSLDAGQTWTQVLRRDGTGQFGCQDLAIRTDSTEDVVFATCRAAPQGAIFRNLDAGGDGTWQAVFTAEFMARTSIAIAPSRQSTVYALAASSEPGTCPSNPGPRPIGPCFRDGMLAVYRSTANGDPDTWEARARNSDEDSQAPSLLSNPSLYFSDVCGGGTKSFSSQGWYDNVIAVDPADPERVWAGGIDLFRSDDGGTVWNIASYWTSRGFRSYVHADQHAIVFYPAYDGAGNKTMYITNDGGIFRTVDSRAQPAGGMRGPCSATNSALVFEELNNGYAVTQFYHGTQFPGGHIYFGGTQDNGTNRGSDVEGHNTWVSVRGGDGGYVAVDPRDARILYTTATRLSFARSANGRNFAGATRGITEVNANFAFITPLIMDPGNPDHLWTGGRSMWRTIDGASVWSAASAQLTSTSSINAIGISPADGNRVIAGTRDGFLYRNAEALSATDESPWPALRLRTGVVSSIAFDPQDPNTAYATYSTFRSAGTDRQIYRTTDGGETWPGIQGEGASAIPDIPIHVVLPDPNRPSTLYAGTDLGIFVSLDNGASWSREDTGFPNTVVESLSIERAGTGSYLMAFTHGRGAWRVWLGPGEPCRYRLSPSRVEVPRAGGNVDVAVETESGCPWSTIPGPTWSALASRASGNGPGVVRFAITTNTGQPREAVIPVADQALRISQP